MISRLRLPRIGAPAKRPTRVRCPVDDWAFDSRYTAGRCPICGWVAEGAASAPLWLAIVNRLDWEMIGLFALADVLVLLGLMVAAGTGLITGHHSGLGLPSGSVSGAASGARHH